MSNAAGFQYFGGPYVTVLSSKTSQRYRLQSDNLSCLWILTQSLESRLVKRFANADKEVPLECSYSSSLPLHEYYSEIELHFHKRKKLMALQEQLEHRSSQFRAIQKRLLSRSERIVERGTHDISLLPHYSKASRYTASS